MRRDQNIQISLSNDEVRAINKWRFEHQVPTLAAAVRELVCRGLENTEAEDPPENKPSATYGVEDCS